MVSPTGASRRRATLNLDPDADRVDLQLDPHPDRPRDPGTDVDDDAPARAARRRADRSERGERRRPPRPQRDGGRECEQPLALEAGERGALHLLILQPHVLDPADRRVDGCRRRGGQLALGLIGRLPPPATTTGRDAPEERPETRERARRPRDEDGGTLGRHARSDRAAEVAEEGDLERAGAVGVEAADHLAATRARELVVGRRRPAVHRHPRARDRDADEQPVALPSGLGPGRRHSGGGSGDEQDEQETLHGSLPKKKAETAPAASSRNAPLAAKAAVISRSFCSCPRREPSSS